MNPNRFKSDMEAAWELRVQTDFTPGSRAHHNRFDPGVKKNEKNERKNPKTGEHRS
ncbi:MAG: hypothetical protein FWH04_01060 [Oscillospiraceae bacterium]|nr:hypothetical protein [Oscillospiraceae bacterium]